MTFDLDALAVDAENAEPFRFTWGGHEFSVPLVSQLSWQDSVAYFTESDLGPIDKLRMLLGDQYDTFLEKPMSAARLGKLLDMWLDAQGTSQGESSASSS